MCPLHVEHARDVVVINLYRHSDIIKYHVSSRNRDQLDHLEIAYGGERMLDQKQKNSEIMQLINVCAMILCKYIT